MAKNNLLNWLPGPAVFFSKVISYFNYINRLADALGLDPELDPDLSGRLG